jgi:hypothetical protein
MTHLSPARPRDILARMTERDTLTAAIAKLDDYAHRSRLIPRDELRRLLAFAGGSDQQTAA